VIGFDSKVTAGFNHFKTGSNSQNSGKRNSETGIQESGIPKPEFRKQNSPAGIKKSANSYVGFFRAPFQCVSDILRIGTFSQVMPDPDSGIVSA
jgi:hypothetical protein